VHHDGQNLRTGAGAGEFSSNSWQQHVRGTSKSDGKNWQHHSIHEPLLLIEELQLQRSVPQPVTGTALRVLVNLFSALV
jgi:hypothetical protein